MDFVKFAHDRNRMCNVKRGIGEGCKGCPLPTWLRWYSDGGSISAGTSGVALPAALSSPLRVVGISLPKNTVRIVALRWAVFTRGASIRVSWIVPGERGTKSCAYNSPEALAKNWEAVK